VTEVLEKLEPFGVTRSGLLVPSELAIVYPGFTHSVPLVG